MRERRPREDPGLRSEPAWRIQGARGGQGLGHSEWGRGF